MKASEKIFHRYKQLPSIYANKVFDEHKIGFSKEDLKQELSVKLIQSIKAYGRRWLSYKKTGLNKPIPIKFYLRLCMVNKVKDIIKDINRQKVSYMAEFDFDYGKGVDSFIDLKRKDVKLNGIDIFSGLADKEQKIVFSMYLKGYTINHISTIFKNKKQINPSEIIRKQKEYLGKHRNDLFDLSKSMLVNTFDEE